MLFWLWPAVLPHRFFGYPALCAVAASYVKRGIKTLKKKEKEKEKRQEERAGKTTVTQTGHGSGLLSPRRLLALYARCQENFRIINT